MDDNDWLRNSILVIILLIPCAVSVLQHIPESRVRIFVVANLQLVPSIAYIIQHATVTYTVELLKQGRVYGQ